MPAFNSCLALLADMVLKCVALTVVFPCGEVMQQVSGACTEVESRCALFGVLGTFCLAGENACFFSNKGN